MKMEYIFVKPQDDYCSSKEKFLDFLCLNSRIQFNNKDVKSENRIFMLFDDNELEYRLEHVLVEKSQESIFHFIVEMADSGENQVEVLEKFDSMIHNMNERSGNLFSISTIWNDVSSYYGRKLYPDILRVENMLRKIIYLFMTKTIGSRWLDASTPEKFQSSVKSTIEKNDKSPTEINGEWLTYADFITLIYFFTAPYSLKSDLKELFNKIKFFVNDKDHKENNQTKGKGTLTEETIQKLSDEFEPKNNWDRYFSDKLSIKSPKKFSDDWSSLYNIRNKVAHGKPIYKKDFVKAVALIRTYSEVFDECINIIDTLEITTEEAKAVEAVAQRVISRKPIDILGNEDMSSYTNRSGLEGMIETTTLLKRKLNEMNVSFNTTEMVNLLKDVVPSIQSAVPPMKIASEIVSNANNLLGVTGYESLTSLETAFSYLADSLKIKSINIALNKPLTIDLPILNPIIDEDVEMESTGNIPFSCEETETEDLEEKRRED